MKTSYTFSSLAAVVLSLGLAAQNNALKIAVTGNSNMSNPVVASEVLFFTPGGSDSLDFSDFSMTVNLSHDSTVQPFTMSADNRTINIFDNRPELLTYTTIPVGFSTDYASVIDVTAVPDSSQQIGYAWLEQNYTGIRYNILNNTVSFPVFANANWNTDYVLHIGPAVVKTITDATCYGSYNGSIEVLNPSCNNWKLDLYQGNTLLQTINMNNPDTVISGLMNGVYTVVSHIGNILADSSLAIVSSPAQVSASFSASTYSTTVGSPVVFTNTSTGGLIYDWDFGDADSSNLLDPVHIYANTGNYVVNLLITNSNGCQSSFSDTIEVLNGPPLRYYQSNNRQDEMNNQNSTERAVNDQPVRISTSERTLTIVNPNDESFRMIQVLDISGQLISETSVNASSAMISVPQSGIYFIRMNLENGKTITRKVMIIE